MPSSDWANGTEIPRFHSFGSLRERMQVIPFPIFSQMPKSGNSDIVIGILKQVSLLMFCHLAGVRAYVKAGNTMEKEWEKQGLERISAIPHVVAPKRAMGIKLSQWDEFSITLLLLARGDIDYLSIFWHRSVPCHRCVGVVGFLVYWERSRDELPWDLLFGR